MQNSHSRPRQCVLPPIRYITPCRPFAYAPSDYIHCHSTMPCMTTSSVIHAIFALVSNRLDRLLFPIHHCRSICSYNAWYAPHTDPQATRKVVPPPFGSNPRSRCASPGGDTHCIRPVALTCIAIACISSINLSVGYYAIPTIEYIYISITHSYVRDQGANAASTGGGSGR